MKIFLKSPINYDTIQIKNGTIEKYVVDYRFNLDDHTLKSLSQYDLPSHPPKLAEILRIVGAYATLWIGTYQGKISPMDGQPTGWTYLSGTEFEPENFWQWVPDSRSERELLQESNVFLRHQMRLGINDGVLKSFVPYKLVLAVDMIPIQRLAGILRKEVDWVFEKPTG
ncbi:MAG: hypothetical protein KME35_23825 [Aphanocapsa sp. GSE-SYN-MK-11-07L]|jgi:hypothetical protein|nr:hypothetical protein [Aphanocapsa sp. GSE-SYN-MK-11-07L]